LRRRTRTLEKERDFAKKGRRLLCEGSGSAFALTVAEKADYPIALMCPLLEVSSRGLYVWRRRGRSARECADAQSSRKIRALHGRSRSTYGSPRVHRPLRRQGTRIGRKRVERIMKRDGLRAATTRSTVSRYGITERVPLVRNLCFRPAPVAWGPCQDSFDVLYGQRLTGNRRHEHLPLGSYVPQGTQEKSRRVGAQW